MKTTKRKTTVKTHESHEPVSVSPPHRTYSGIDGAFEYFNHVLFGGVLPRCLVTLTRKRRSMGYYSAKRFCSLDGQEIVDEIALNPQHFNGTSVEEILSTLVHEMVHLWQHHCGTPPKSPRYHDTQWANKMESVGLMPSDTGKPGGKRTGAHVSDYILEDGPFIRACAARKFDRTTLFYDVAQEPDGQERKMKTTYTCSGCGLNAWGKPDSFFSYDTLSTYIVRLTGGNNMRPTRPTSSDVLRAIELAENSEWLDPLGIPNFFWECLLYDPDGRQVGDGIGDDPGLAMAFAWLHVQSPDALIDGEVLDDVPLVVPDGWRFELTPPAEGARPPWQVSDRMAGPYG
jgi:hypothetical protein